MTLPPSFKKSSSVPNADLRYYLLDSVRGILILGMIVYHALFDIFLSFGMAQDLLSVTVLNVIRDLGAAAFIFLSGICVNFERHFIRRNVILTAAGIVITLVTALAAPELTVWFGILTFMGVAGFIMAVLRNVFLRLPAGFSLLLSLLSFFVFFGCYRGYLGAYDLVLCYLPQSLYRNYLTAFFGFPFIGFSSGDYFPILPWIFIYFAGFFFWRKFSGFLSKNRLIYLRVPFLEKIGKFSLIIYIVHQPVLYGLSYLISLVNINKT